MAGAKEVRYPPFHWWQGIVEDRNDPAYMGRYRVRIFGYHTANKEQLPTENLPWSVPMQPVTSAAISGVGHSPTGLVEGSAVVGFFVDGDEGQMPVIIGSFGVNSFLPKDGEDGTGAVSDPDRSAIGFYDPTYLYPKRKITDRGDAGGDYGLTNHSSGRPRDAASSQNRDGKYDEGGEDVGENILEEPDMSRLARNRADKKKAEEHYSLKAKRDSRVKEIPIAYASAASGADRPMGMTHPDDGSGEEIEINDPKYIPSAWSEPHPQGTPPDASADPEESKSQYPFNHVFESESGHVREMDDTPGAERIHEYHKAGTFYEILPNGDKVTKIVGNGFEIDMKNKMIYVAGDYSMTVDGDYYLNVKGNKTEHISGHCFQTVKGTRVAKIQGNDLFDTESNMKLHVLKNYNAQIGSNDPDYAKNPGNFNMRVTGEYSLRVRDKIKTIGMSDRKDITFGNHKINVYPKFEIDFALGRKAIETGDTAAIMDSILGKSKLELFAQQDVSIATGQLYPDPFFPTSPFPSVSIATARYNLAASADLYEKIGPGIGFNPASAIPKIGFATRNALIGINDVVGFDPAVFTLMPGVNSFASYGGITNTVILGGMFNTVLAGGMVDIVAKGGKLEYVVAGGMFQGVGAGGIEINAFAGAAKFGATVGGTLVGNIACATVVTGVTVALV